MLKLTNIFSYNLMIIYIISLTSLPFQLLHYILSGKELDYRRYFKLYELSIDSTPNNTDIMIIKQKEFIKFYNSYIIPTFMSSFLMPISLTAFTIVVYTLILFIMLCVGNYKSFSYFDEPSNRTFTYSPLYGYLFLILLTFFYWVLLSPFYCGLFWNGLNILEFYYMFFEQSQIASAEGILFVLRYNFKWLIALNLIGVFLFTFTILAMIIGSFKLLYTKIRDLRDKLRAREATNSINNNSCVQFANDDVEIKSSVTFDWFFCIYINTQ